MSTPEGDEPVLHQLARKGDIEMWAAVTETFKKLGLLQEVFKSCYRRCCIYWRRWGMLVEVATRRSQTYISL